MDYKELMDLLSSAPYYTKQNLDLKIKGNTEYWIKKLLKEGLLINLKKGTYISPYYIDTALKTPQEKERYFEYLANVLRKPSYVSLEYMLAKYGAIPEAVFSISSVTTKITRSYNTEVGSFLYRSISSNLFTGYKEVKFKDKSVKVAKLSKALFDFIYFKELKEEDLLDFLTASARINWDVFEKGTLDEFYSYLKFTDSLKMQTAYEIIKKKGLLC